MEDWILKSEDSFRYQLLSRLKMDCDYYLGNGNRNPSNLWAEEEAGQIRTMKMLWRSFPDEDKPEWLTWEEILEYERKMCTGKIEYYAVYKGFSQHDCESVYKCPVCEATFGYWAVFYQEKNENGTKVYCPKCKTELKGLN